MSDAITIISFMVGIVAVATACLLVPGLYIYNRKVEQPKWLMVLPVLATISWFAFDAIFHRPKTLSNISEPVLVGFVGIACCYVKFIVLDHTQWRAAGSSIVTALVVLGVVTVYFTFPPLPE